MELADKVVVVTGGGAGIGREVVLELLRRGATVAAVDLREEGLSATAELAAADARLGTFTVDVTDREAVAALPGKVIAAHGAVDVLVNVAGIIQPFVPVSELDRAAVDRVIDVNLTGTINTVTAFLPHLMERPEAHVANVSSMGAVVPVPGQSIYGASKAAVKLLSEGLYAELMDSPVGVSVVIPGAVETEITTNSGVAMPGGGATAGKKSRLPTTSAPDAAGTILDGIEAGRLHIWVGRDARLLGILSRVAPKRVIHLVQRQMKSLRS